MSRAVGMLLLHCKAERLPPPETEHRFHDKRRFRFDLAWPAYLLAAEVDGGTWTQGRHTRGKGYESDCVKTNLAIELGWSVLRYTTAMVDSGEAVRQIKRVLYQRLTLIDGVPLDSVSEFR